MSHCEVSHLHVTRAAHQLCVSPCPCHGVGRPQHELRLRARRASAVHDQHAYADGRKITTVSEMQEAARDLADLGPKAVLVKGGHLPVPDRGSSAAAATLVDVLYNRSTEDIRELATPRLTTDNTHGTGCTMASAIAAHLARGESVHVAVEAAQRYVHECIARSVPLSLGGGSQGAMDHGAGLVEIGGGGVGRGVGREAAAARATRRVQHELDYSVYAVTDDGMNARHSRPMDQAVREAVAGGATVIQIRCVRRACRSGAARAVAAARTPGMLFVPRAIRQISGPLDVCCPSATSAGSCG